MIDPRFQNYHDPEEDDDLSNFYSITDAFQLKFRRFPVTGTGVRMQLRNLGDSPFPDITIREIFDKVRRKTI